jgi:hypothetical protein
MGSKLTQEGFTTNVSMTFPLFLAPLLFFGFSAALSLGLILHLINAIIFSRILFKLNLDQKFVFLYAFFPSLFWLSRTLYPQTLAITFLLLGFFTFLLFHKQKGVFKEEKIQKLITLFLSGLFFGFSVFIRPELVFAAGLFFLVLIVKQRLFSIPFALGALIPALLLFLVNLLQFGSISSTAYGSTSSSFLVRTLLGISLPDLVIIAVALSIFYPLLFPAVFIRTKKNPFFFEIIALVLGSLLIQLNYANLLDISINPLSFYFVNLRYLSPAFPFMIIAFAFFAESAIESKVISKFLSKFKFSYFSKLRVQPEQSIFFLGILFLVALSFGFSFYHSDFLNDRKEVMQQIYSNTPADALIIGSSDDKMFFPSTLLSEREYIRIDAWNDVAGLDKNFDIKPLLNNNSYIIQLEYSNRVGRDSFRQIYVINEERKVIADFIEENNASLQLVYSSDSPHFLDIYKWVGVVYSN